MDLRTFLMVWESSHYQNECSPKDPLPPSKPYQSRSHQPSSEYKQIYTNFIWHDKRPRISWERLKIPRLKGGVGLLDICKYYWSCHLARVIDWHVHTRTKAWFKLEESFFQDPVSSPPVDQAKPETKT